MIVLCDVFFVVVFEVVKLWQFYWLTVFYRVIQYKYMIVLFIFDMTFTFFFLIQFLKKIIERTWNPDVFMFGRRLHTRWFVAIATRSPRLRVSASTSRVSRSRSTSPTRSSGTTSLFSSRNVGYVMGYLRIFLCLKTIWFILLPLIAWQFNR